MDRRLITLVGAALYTTRLHRLLLRERAVIAVFHRVNDDLPGDPITCSSAEFVAFCRFFKRHFDVVPLGELFDRLARGRPLAGRLAITFDDGYRDNYDIAAPILEAHGLPACFFVTTDLIGSTTVPAWDLKNGVQSEWMTWDQVRHLVARGFEIGAHTEDHADLGQVNGAAARRSIEGSRRRLTQELGRPVPWFAYPFGGRDKMTEPNRQVVRASGFACCLSAYGGTVPPRADPFDMRRTPVTPWHSNPWQYGMDLIQFAREERAETLARPGDVPPVPHPTHAARDDDRHQ